MLKKKDVCLYYVVVLLEPHLLDHDNVVRALSQDFCEGREPLLQSCDSPSRVENSGMLCHIMLLWSIEPKIDCNRLLPTIESKNLVAIMIVSNSALLVVL